MSFLTTPEQSEFTASDLTHLEECSETSVYAPGYIQPHGILLVLQEPDLKILQVSENVEQFFGIPAITVIGKSLHRLFSRLQVQQIAEFLQQDDLEFYKSLEVASSVPKSLAPQDLKIMPINWINQVHEAALDWQDERLNQLIAQIPDSEQWLIEVMTSLVDTFQFEAIATLAQNQEESS